MNASSDRSIVTGRPVAVGQRRLELRLGDEVQLAADSDHQAAVRALSDRDVEAGRTEAPGIGLDSHGAHHASMRRRGHGRTAFAPGGDRFRQPLAGARRGRGGGDRALRGRVGAGGRAGRGRARGNARAAERDRPRGRVRRRPDAAAVRAPGHGRRRRDGRSARAARVRRPALRARRVRHEGGAGGGAGGVLRTHRRSGWPATWWWRRSPTRSTRASACRRRSRRCARTRRSSPSRPRAR